MSHSGISATGRGELATVMAGGRRFVRPEHVSSVLQVNADEAAKKLSGGLLRGGSAACVGACTSEYRSRPLTPLHGPKTLSSSRQRSGPATSRGGPPPTSGLSLIRSSEPPS